MRKRRKIIDVTEEAERKANNEAYVPTAPDDDTVVLKGPFAAGTSNNEI